MTRSTLKLPVKSAAPDDAWTPPRKPLRGGVKGKKPSSSTKRNPPAPHQPLPADEPGVRARRAPTPRAPTAARLADAKKAEATTPQTAGKRTDSLPRDPGRPDVVRPPTHTAGAPAKKVHPKRGIARSTGARALPPARPAGNATRHEGDMPGAASAPPTPPRPSARPAQPTQPASQPERIATQAAGPADGAAPRRTLPEPPRLAKRVAEMALCSRRLADEWIENGWVSVDGIVVTTLGARVHARADIRISDAAQAHRSEAVTIIYNRPPADDATQPPEEAGQVPRTQIRDDNHWADDETRVAFKPTHLRGLAPAGKLDAEASGMLVFTQEGSVARRITGDETRLEKEYLVRIDGQLDAEGLARLCYGLELDGVKLKRAQVSRQNEQQLRFVLHETRKKQIARMCELVGLRVVAIKRIRIGSVSLGKLPAGQWRYLRDNERF